MREKDKSAGGLSEAAGKRLLKIAREALESVVRSGRLPEQAVEDPELQGHQGAFVTLNKDGRLRGCVGRFTSSRPLYRVVREMARSVALEDTRFQPVAPEELAAIEIDISVLSPLRRVTDPLGEVRLGRDGIYIRKGSRAGTYLPQVAVEHNMSLEEFLSSCAAHKAGLPPDAWRDPDVEVYAYTAQVLEEKRGG